MQTGYPPPIVSGVEFLYLILILGAMLLIGWVWFFAVMMRNKESIREMLAEGAFLQNLTVIGVVLTSGCLAVVRILPGDLAATLLSGIVGYVLGSIRHRQ